MINQKRSSKTRFELRMDVNVYDRLQRMAGEKSMALLISELIESAYRNKYVQTCNNRELPKSCGHE